MPYEYLYRIDGRSLPDLPQHICRDLVAIAETVRRRTGCSAWYDRIRRTVMYPLGDLPGGAPYEDTIFFGKKYLPIKVEETIKRIRYTIGRSLAEKEELIDRHERMLKQRSADKIHKSAEDVEYHAKDLLKYHERKLENPRSQRVFGVEHKVGQ